MRIQKFILVLIGILTLISTGCTFEKEYENQKIIVQKRVGDEPKYEHFREITDNEQVKKALELLDKTKWENAVVDMVRPPDYQFYFEKVKKMNQPDGLEYSLWVSPNKDKIEIVIEGEGKYVQLNKEKSAELFKIITGEKLSDCSCKKE